MPFDGHETSGSTKAGTDAENESEHRQSRGSSGDAPKQPAEQDAHQDAGNDDDKPDKPRSKKPLIIIAAVVVILAIVAFLVWFLYRNQVSTDDAYTDGNTISMVPKVSGYIVKTFIDDNSHVKAGDLLLEIDPRDYLTAQAQAQAQLALARAQLASAEQSLKVAQVQYPAQLRAAEAQRSAAVAAAASAQASFERQHRVDSRATTQESIDSSTSQQKNASASVTNADAQLAIARLAPEQVQQAASTVAERQASVQQAEAQLAQANLNVSYTQVRAPTTGFITMRNVQLGSYVTPQQVMFLLVTPEVWITANFKESQIGRMRPGDRVDVAVDAYSSLKLEGHVQSIQYGSGSRFSSFPAENATGNFVKIVQRVPVKIVIDRGLDPNRPVPLGLSVTPTVYFP